MSQTTAKATLLFKITNDFHVDNYYTRVAILAIHCDCLIFLIFYFIQSQ